MKNDVLTVIARRRSVREFNSTPIPPEKLEKVIIAGTYAPSPFNNQPWRFIACSDTDTIKKITRITAEKIDAFSPVINKEATHDFQQYRKNALFFSEAGALIIVLMKPLIAHAKNRFWGVSDAFSYEDRVRSDIMCIGAACQNILLAAESLNLSACLMQYPLIADDKVREMMNIKRPWEIMAYIPLGNKSANTSVSVPKRRPVDRIIRYIRKDEQCR
jgi:nitroreductase